MRRPHSTRTCIFIGLGLFTVLALSGPARAQVPALPASPEPLRQGAPQQASSLAAERFAEGTALFKQWHFDKAEEKLREALGHWEHPLIHLYLSRALEKQGRLVEAHASLQQVLRPGAEALPPEDAKVAEELQKSLESRLAQIEISCDVPGAEVSLDGESLFTAPGRQRRIMSAGQHVLIARKSGYFPVAEPVSLIPGKRSRIVLRMAADVIHVERRWQPWQPWAIAGTGIAMSLAGGWLRWQAASDYTSFKDALESCMQTISCQMVSTRRLDSGEWKELVGTGTLITGGTILAVGLASVILNLPRTRRSEPTSGIDYEFSPMVSGDIAGISGRLRF